MDGVQTEDRRSQTDADLHGVRLRSPEQWIFVGNSIIGYSFLKRYFAIPVFPICIKRCHARCSPFSYVFNFWIKMASTSDLGNGAAQKQAKVSCRKRAFCPHCSETVSKTTWYRRKRLSTTELSRAAWSCSLPLTAISDCQLVCRLCQSHQWLSACVRAMVVTSVTVSLCAVFDYLIMHIFMWFSFCAHFTCPCISLFMYVHNSFTCDVFACVL